MAFPYHPPSPSARSVTVATLPKKKATRYAWHDARVRWAIAKQVHDLRMSRGWSQHELARRSGVSVMTIWRLEKPSRVLGCAIRSLLRIANAFDVALMTNYVTWGEWLEFQRKMEGGFLPQSFDEERASASSDPTSETSQP